MKQQNELQGMRLLTDFEVEHSAYGKFVLLHSSFTDTMTAIFPSHASDFPDQQVMIRLDVAKALISELQKRVDYIEAGIEHNEFKILD
ncbi:hypothetical protein [Serratia fonticola]|uniref:Uncharacterized protein n=1 Tax=Serratia fonticola TaxID=47917 RepID=A0AAW3WT14_SERFO|nr:hypothetical protein [Serratia fonticola]MBC3213879.1 hypothetical protein [Serratia fonticola]NYA13152.1 hypothetical protein [Serratia fonticola]NYA33479.1 hypothetical protein [Serratia fonticola]HBE9178744.1 hypothetical protein [Serratia fonticola]